MPPDQPGAPQNYYEGQFGERIRRLGDRGRTVAVLLGLVIIGACAYVQYAGSSTRRQPRHAVDVQQPVPLDPFPDLKGVKREHKEELFRILTTKKTITLSPEAMEKLRREKAKQQQDDASGPRGDR